jgi:hypothetical protein
VAAAGCARLPAEPQNGSLNGSFRLCASSPAFKGALATEQLPNLDTRSANRCATPGEIVSLARGFHSVPVGSIGPAGRPRNACGARKPPALSEAPCDANSADSRRQAGL